ncbi:MAG: class I SAM-dependent methyltransferase [Balneolaceae bacterium]
MEIVNPQIKPYLESHTSPESDLLRELVRKSEEELTYTDMISGRQVGQLLQMLIRIGRFSRILEIGTFTGYSAITMADVLPDNGEVLTLELNERYRDVSEPFFKKEPYNKKIRQIMGDARETLVSLDGFFDMVFIDAEKLYYPEYYKKSLPLLKKGGVMVIDNTLWSGGVLDPDTPKGEAIDEFNKMIQADDRVDNLMLPVRDGVTVVYKK